MERTYIKDLKPDVEQKMQGFIDKIRETKSMIFVVLKDTTGKIQVTVDRNSQPNIANEISGKLAGSVLTVLGTPKISPYVKMNGVEVIPDKIIVESSAEALPINDEANIDQRLAYRWIDLRDEKKALVFKIETDVEKTMRDFMLSQNFVEIHTPKISAQSSEGGSELFELTYFGQKAFLTQSPQFYKQMAMASGFERVFEFGDCFRAESSFTSRHATEFLSFDVEMSYIKDHYDVMKLEEDLLTYTLKKIAEKYGDEIKSTFGVDVKVPQSAFPRISYNDALDILKNEYNYVGAKNDFDTESERLICDYALKKYGSEFVFITEYPFSQRAFYSMKCDDNSGLCKSYDLLWKDQEITSGAQREHRPSQLTENIKEKGIKPENMANYISFFRYGCPPHGGFAIGMARLIAKLLGLPNIKESTFIFRGPHNILP